MSQITAATGVGSERANGVAQVSSQPDAFAAWLRKFNQPNVDLDTGNKLPSDRSVLVGHALRLRGAVPLSEAITTEVSVKKFTQDGVSVERESRVGRLEVREVQGPVTRDVRLVLALRKPGQDYTVEPTKKFDPIGAARESRRGVVEYVPVQPENLDIIDQVLTPGTLASLQKQATTIESQAREYITWAQ